MPTYTGTSASDTFTAPTDENWTIIGLGGKDTLTGAGGDDTIIAGKGVDILNGGGGNDTFLVSANGGADTYDGGDSAFIGGNGYDVIRASADNVKIGIESITGIEEISADGHTGVTISGSANDNVLDFSAVTLTGIGLIFGGNGNDTITGNATAPNIIDGGAGNDTLVGGGADDTFQVGKNAGMESFTGGDGNDTIVATADGVHIGLAAFTGIETISGGGFANVMVDGTAGDDYLYFGKMTLDGISAVNGGDGDDTIIGSAGDDTLRGGAGDDVISGGAGNDSLYGDQGHDILSGGPGDDSFYVSAGADIYKGGSGYDVIYATQNGSTLQLDQGSLNGIEELSANGFSNVTISGANPDGSRIDLRHLTITDGDIAGINGTNGNDTIFGSQVADLIHGGLGDDMLSGFNGDDEIHGGGGNDSIIGGNGSDVLYGEAGNDTLNGGAGDDVIYGGPGNDTIVMSANPGFDEIHGDVGFDTIVADQGVRTIKFFSFDGIEAISWDGSHVASVQGTTGDDTFDFSGVVLTGISSINGADGNDTIIGSSEADTIDGGIGNDTLSGGGGADILIGSVGTDTLTGGDGADIFKDTATNLNGDTITDFSMGDAIDITNAKTPTSLVLDYSSGVLNVTGVGIPQGGLHISMAGDFTTASFQVVSDGVHGSLVQLVQTPVIA